MTYLLSKPPFTSVSPPKFPPNDGDKKKNRWKLNGLDGGGHRFAASPLPLLRQAGQLSACLRCRIPLLLKHLKLVFAGGMRTVSSRPVPFSLQIKTPIWLWVFLFVWRRTRDSNPRGCYTLLAFQASSLATRSILQMYNF